MKHIAIVTALIATLLLIVLTVRAQDDPPPDADTLFIGFYGDPDSPAAQGMELAIQQIDSEGGFTGADGRFYRFEAQFADDPAELTEAVSVLVLPPSEATTANAPTRAQDPVQWPMPVIMLSPDAPLGLRGVQATIFRGMTMPIHQSDALIDFLVTQSTVRRVTFIGENTHFESITEGVNAAGLVEVQQRESALLTAAEFQGLMAYDPHLILYDADAESAASLITALVERDWGGFFLYSDAPALLEGIELDDLGDMKLLGTTTWINSADDDLSQAFVDAFVEEFDDQPDATSVAAYDLTWAVRLMIGRIGAEPDLLIESLPITDLIRTTEGNINPAQYGPSELYRNVTIFEYLPGDDNQTRVLARYDGGNLITVGQEVVAFATVTPVPSATPSDFMLTISSETVNVRTGPGDAYAVIGQLGAGDQVQVLARLVNSEAWLLVRSPWGPAWIITQAGTLHDPDGSSLPRVQAPAPPTARPPAPPQPTSPPAAPASTAVSDNTGTGRSAGGSFALGGHVANQSNPDLVRSAGMTWIKEQIRWERGETPANGAAPAIAAAHDSGLKILVSSVGWNYEMGNLDAYMDEYTAYLGQVAALGPDAIEIWNEPNIDREWVAGQINGATYTRLLEKAYNAIKGANPNVMVVSAALAPTGFFGGNCTANGCDDDVFLRQMAAAGAANFMDCVGVHYNEGIVAPSQRSGDPRGDHHSRYLPSMLDLYHGAFNGAKPLCFTELGYLTADGFGGLPAGFEWAAGTSLDEHANWLGAAVSMTRGDSRVRFLMVWNVNFGEFGSDPRAAYAILRPDGSCPACGTLAAAMQ